jgi:hypothetical protein
MLLEIFNDIPKDSYGVFVGLMITYAILFTLVLNPMNLSTSIVCTLVLYIQGSLILSILGSWLRIDGILLERGSLNNPLHRINQSFVVFYVILRSCRIAKLDVVHLLLIVFYTGFDLAFPFVVFLSVYSLSSQKPVCLRFSDKHCSRAVVCKCNQNTYHPVV